MTQHDKTRETTPVWLLEEAIDVIREAQFKALQCGYHLSLGGGVLNKGHSYNDLDVAVLPLGDRLARRETLLAGLERLWGPAESLGYGGIGKRFVYKDKYIDVLFYERAEKATQP